MKPPKKQRGKGASPTKRTRSAREKNRAKKKPQLGIKTPIKKKMKQDVPKKQTPIKYDISNRKVTV